MLEKGKGLLKKLRELAGKPRVWGAIAVFSPTLVACYGMPYDCNEGSYDCINGYVGLCEQGSLSIQEDVNPETNLICHGKQTEDYNEVAELRMGKCTSDGFIATDNPCEYADTHKLFPTSSHPARD